MHELIIIGGGPAGMTAALYASRKKIKTLVLTRDFMGQVGRAFVVENYPGFKEIRGLDLAIKMREQLEGFSSLEIKEGVEVSKIEETKGNFLIKTPKTAFSAKSVIIATGREPRRLAVAGEEKLLGRGVAYCVTCDGPLYKEKRVAVIGGGNSGFGGALELAGYASEVFLLHNLSSPTADKLLQERAERNGKIKLILNVGVLAFEGDKSLKKIIYLEKESNLEKELEVEAAFIEIGYIPAVDFAKDLVDLNRFNEIVVNPLTCQTKTKGLFAAGDVTSEKVKQIVTAAGAGSRAAVNVFEYLQGNL